MTVGACSGSGRYLLEHCRVTQRARIKTLVEAALSSPVRASGEFSLGEVSAINKVSAGTATNAPPSAASCR